MKVSGQIAADPAGDVDARDRGGGAVDHLVDAPVARQQLPVDLEDVELADERRGHDRHSLRHLEEQLGLERVSDLCT